MKYLPFGFKGVTITEPDKEFARKLRAKFKLKPLSDVLELIYLTKIQLNFLPALNESSAAKNLSKNTFLKDISSISLKTEKLTIEINSSDKEFEYFKTPLERLQVIILKDLKKTDKKIFDSVVDYIIYQSKIFHEAWFPTVPMRQHIYIGMFLVYFKLHKGSKPYLTEEKFTPGTFQDYDHYLAAIGKARMNKKIPSKK